MEISFISACAAIFLHFVAKLEFLKDMEKRKLSVCVQKQKIAKRNENFTRKVLEKFKFVSRLCFSFFLLWVTQHSAVLNGTKDIKQAQKKINPTARHLQNAFTKAMK
jgi:hypothetical protein